MKFSAFSLFRRLAVLALPVSLFTSCVEQSVVVKVNKDGSGIVHERSYMNDSMGNMFAGGLGLGGDESTGGGGEVTVESTGNEIPTKEDLEKVAAKMGEGVTVGSITPGKNKSGWSGYEAIYHFTDINQLKLNLSDFGSSDMEDLAGDLGGAEAEGAGEAESDADETVTFSMADGVLTIVTPDPTGSFEGMGGGAGLGGGEEGGVEGGAGNPFGDLDPADPESAMALQMMSGMTAGMRVGMFVQAADPIASTNARHQNGNMVTLMMMDMGQLFKDPANLAKMESLENETDRDAMQKVIDEVDGITADLQSPITITFE